MKTTREQRNAIIRNCPPEALRSINLSADCNELEDQLAEAVRIIKDIDQTFKMPHLKPFLAKHKGLIK